MDPYISYDGCVCLGTTTQFCDEDGYEVTPVKVVFVIHSEIHSEIKDSSNREVPLILQKEHKATSLEDLASSESECSPFRIPLQMITQQCVHTTIALIDSYVSLNVLSWETWDALGQLTLSPTRPIVLKMRIQDESMHAVFYVANKCKALESVILGRTWIQFTNCQLDRKDQTYSIQVNSYTLTGLGTTCIEDFLH